MTNKFYTHIGEGYCGSVWTDWSSHAFKLGDASFYRSLRNDAEMHQRVLEAANKVNEMAEEPEHTVPVCIPKFFRFENGGPASAWWQSHLAGFNGERLPCDVLVSERIPHFSQEVRHRLIDRYCPEKRQEAVKSSTSNEHCLIRCLLGKSAPNTPSRFITPMFSLRNHRMSLQRMNELGLPVRQYAEVMATTLAMLHCVAEVDACDVEFVLAPPPLSGNRGVVFESSEPGMHCLWLLDFDLVKSKEDGLAWCKKAAEASYNNELYYPRPGDELWPVFRNRYERTSKGFLGGSGMQMAFGVMDAWEELHKQKVQRQASSTY